MVLFCVFFGWTSPLWGQAEKYKEQLNILEHVNSMDLDSAYRLALTIRADSWEDGDTLAYLYSMYRLALIQRDLGKLHEAMTTIEGAKVLLPEGTPSEIRGNIYLAAGHIYNHLGEQTKAEGQYIKAIEDYKAMNDTTGLVITWGSLGITHFDQGKVKQSLHFYQLADSVWMNKDSTGRADLWNNIGVSYQELEDYPRSIHYFTKALGVYERFGKERSIPLSYYNLGETNMMLGNYELSEQQFLASLEKGLEVNSLEDVKWAYDGLYQLFKEKKDYQKALEYHEIYSAYSDSIKETSSKKEVEQMVDGFEQKRFNRLLKLEMHHQEKERDFESKIQWLGMIALLSLTLVGVISYLRVRKGNKMLIEERFSVMAKRRQIDAALLEKELLLKEIHHRVKNNLQIISSLLNLQKHQIDDPRVLMALEESQNRIQAIALVHKKLYQDESIAQVQFKSYLEELISHLEAVHRGDTLNVQYDIYTQGIALNLDTAVPLGLIVAELITNSFKYAFKAGEENVMTIRLTKETEPYYDIEVADNGVGLPSEFDLEQADSLGLEIVRALVDQLDGTITTVPHKGAKYKIRFVQIHT